MDALKRKLFCELEMYEDAICACDGELSECDVNSVYKLCKTLYYLDLITKGDKAKHHRHIHYDGDDEMPDFEMGMVHHHMDVKEEEKDDISASRVVKREVMI